MTFREFQHYLDADGRMVNYEAFRESIYYGGVEPSLRKVVWRHLLCVFPEGMQSTFLLVYRTLLCIWRELIVGVNHAFLFVTQCKLVARACNNNFLCHL